MSRNQVLRLYKALLRESTKFPAYNFREYALRRVKDSFRSNKSLTDQSSIAEKMLEANKNLECIRRQVIIGQLYSTDKLVIEKAILEKQLN